MDKKIKLPNYTPDMGTKKMKELILFISKLSMDDPKFGATKLNKLLFYVDFEAFRRLGKSVTEKIYENLEEGPVPKCIVPVRDEMITKDKDLIISNVTYFDRTQNRTIPLRNPNLNVFTPKEIEIIHEVLEENKHLNGKEISLKSHNFIGWRITKSREEIDYRMALIGDRFPTEEEVEYGLSL